MEELRLRAFLARQELHVVHEQHVDAAIALAEIQDAIVANGVDHLVHEPLGRDVSQLQIFHVRDDIVPDGVHQVRLPESHPAVDEQRVVRSRRRFGDRTTGGVRELVRRSDDEGVERVARTEDPEVVTFEFFLADSGVDVFRARHLGNERLRAVLGHEGHGRTGALHFGERFFDHGGVMLRA